MLFFSFCFFGGEVEYWSWSGVLGGLGGLGSMTIKSVYLQSNNQWLLGSAVWSDCMYEYELRGQKPTQSGNTNGASLCHSA